MFKELSPDDYSVIRESFIALGFSNDVDDIINIIESKGGDVELSDLIEMPSSDTITLTPLELPSIDYECEVARIGQLSSKPSITLAPVKAETLDYVTPQPTASKADDLLRLKTKRPSSLSYNVRLNVETTDKGLTLGQRQYNQFVNFIIPIITIRDNNISNTLPPKQHLESIDYHVTPTIKFKHQSHEIKIFTAHEVFPERPRYRKHHYLKSFTVPELTAPEFTSYEHADMREDYFHLESDTELYDRMLKTIQATGLQIESLKDTIPSYEQAQMFSYEVENFDVTKGDGRRKMHRNTQHFTDYMKDEIAADVYETYYDTETPIGMYRIFVDRVFSAIWEFIDMYEEQRLDEYYGVDS